MDAVTPFVRTITMPKPLRNRIIQGTYFRWRLLCREHVWYADGRSNTLNAGRHSLGSKDRLEALQRLTHLDQRMAEDLGLIPRSNRPVSPSTTLSLFDGRRLYEEHLARPRATGGVRSSTRKRYKAVFDKFVPFAQSRGILNWNAVDACLLERYAAHLEQEGYQHKTLVNELTTLKQTVRWLIDENYLTGREPIKLRLRKAESQRAYCWKLEEVKAIIAFCESHKQLRWIGDVVIALACTGLRISELAALRWPDIDLEGWKISLTDETAHAGQGGVDRRHLKTGRSRSFPIHADLAAVLGRLPRNGTYVFHGPRGGRLKPDTVRNVLVREVISKLATQFATPEGKQGFVDGRLHSFRHYFCSRCANSGIPDQMIMEWLGHRDSEMVRHYYHLCDAESRRRMNSLDLIGNAGTRVTGALTDPQHSNTGKPSGPLEEA